MDNAPELPESEDALYELAARSDADPYRKKPQSRNWESWKATKAARSWSISRKMAFQR